MPTVKKVTHEFAGSKFFGKLDARSVFWCSALDDESSYVTTFALSLADIDIYLCHMVLLTAKMHSKPRWTTS